MIASRRALCAVCLAAAAALSACDQGYGNPSTPSIFTTEVFTGSVVKGGRTIHKFATGQTAPVLLRMTAFTPSTIVMGLALGQPITVEGVESCSITVGTAAVQQGAEFQVELPPGSYCINIFDAGQIGDEQTVTYSTTIQHK
jgi:hypothetical protein